MTARWAGALVGVLLVAGCAGGTGVEGRLVAIDDTGLDDVAIEEGWIAAVPDADDVAALWPGLETDEPRYLSEPLEPDQVERAGGVTVPVGDRGRFTLELPSGSTLLCRVTGSLAEPLVRGCSIVDLPDVGRVTATVGEGGFDVTVRD